MANKGKTIYVPVKYRAMVERYCLGSAGPYPNITGMRQQYWGNAPLIRCGAYVYRMDWNDFERFLNLD